MRTRISLLYEAPEVACFSLLLVLFLFYGWGGTIYAQEPLVMVVRDTLVIREVTGSAQSLFGPGVDGLTPAQLLYIPGPAGLLPIPLIVTYRVIVRDPGKPEGYRTAATTAKVYLDIQFAAGETATINLHLNAGL